MKEKYKQFYRYARLVVKPAGFVFTLVAILLVGIQILQTMGENITTGWLALFFVGFAFWLLDTIWSTLEDWDKLSEKPKKPHQPSK
jgi:uncharacterized membrane protein